jgi:XTP/dITP diphosphohydrolase
VTSSRYAGPAADDRANYEKLLRQLAPYLDPERRRARFVCSLACADGDGRLIAVRGEWPGTIVAAPRGDGGFGYDPVVLPDGSDRTVAELTEAEKDRESHRARAARALLARLSLDGAA